MLIIKKSDLKQGMIVLTTGGRYGVVVEKDETSENCIKFLYDPLYFPNKGCLKDILLLDEVDENLNIFYLARQQDVDDFNFLNISIGDKIIAYQIIEVFEPQRIWKRKNLKPSCCGLMGDNNSD